MIRIWGKQSDFIVLMLLMTLFVFLVAGITFAFLSCCLPPEPNVAVDGLHGQGKELKSGGRIKERKKKQIQV